MAHPSPVIPPDSGEWLAALHELSLCCADDVSSDVGDRARELNQLLQRAPDASLLHGLLALELVQLEAMLATNAADAAIMAMFRHDASYLVSRAGNGHCLATVVLANRHREQSGAGATPALALIGAIALSLVQEGHVGHVPARRMVLARPAVLH